jgi:hypothetical protein
MLLAGLFSATAGMMAATPISDPYAVTAPGWMLCTEPDDVDRTCSNLASFEKTGDHSYRSHVVTNWTGTDYLFEYDQDVRVIDGKDCSPAKEASYENIRFRRGERILQGKEFAEAQARMRRELVGAGSVQGCASISGEANELTLNVEIVGEPKPGYYVILRSIQHPLKWVHLEDGYRVRTWSALKS